MPPSLKKIYEVLEEEIKFGFYLDQDPSLIKYAEQGVLLLNASLTVDEGIPNSHKGIGWEFFMERVLALIKDHPKDLVIMLWGTYAKNLRYYVDNGRHIILEAEHPVMGARENRMWINNQCFTKANLFLQQKGYGEIIW